MESNSMFLRPKYQPVKVKPVSHSVLLITDVYKNNHNMLIPPTQLDLLYQCKV